MILIGDIGNTDTKIFLFNNKYKAIVKKRFKTKLLSTNFIYKNFSFLKNKKKKSAYVIFSSVVPKKFLIIKNSLKKFFNLNCEELKKQNLNNFIKIKVNKKQIGSDRLANAISILDNKYNYIVVDFGTATNFDVIIKNQYIGGVIAPGVALSLNNLISKASLIPNIKLSFIKKIIGTNTSTAVKSGFFHGYSGLLNSIIHQIHLETKKKFRIILTGGFSHLFKKSIKYKNTIKKDLTINGILKIAIKNKYER